MTNFRVDKTRRTGNRAAEVRVTARAAPAKEPILQNVTAIIIKGAHYNTSPCQHSPQSTRVIADFLHARANTLLYFTRGSDDISRRRRGDSGDERTLHFIDNRMTRGKKDEKTA